MFADAVKLNHVREFNSTDDQTLSWQPAAGIESYEVYIQRIGENDAVYRVADIVGSNHTLAQPLPKGEYKLWIRGSMADGGMTRWGRAYSISVGDWPVASFADGLLTWTTGESSGSDDVRFEIWINRTDEPNRTSRVVNATDLVAARFETDEFDDGDYRVWVRKLDNGRATRWSDPLNVTVSHQPQLAQAFGQDLTTLMRELDGA